MTFNCHIYVPHPLNVNITHVDSQAQTQILERLQTMSEKGDALSTKLDEALQNNQDLSAKVDALLALVQAAAGGISAEEADTLIAKATEVVAGQQAVEDK